MIVISEPGIFYNLHVEDQNEGSSPSINFSGNITPLSLAGLHNSTPAKFVLNAYHLMSKPAARSRYHFMED
jgi:hypothetical protein